MQASELVKGEWYRLDNGFRAKLLESPKQGRGYKSVVLMDVRGFFDEMGSVYVSDISHELIKGDKYSEEEERHTRDEWNELDYKWIMDEFASGSNMI